MPRMRTGAVMPVFHQLAGRKQSGPVARSAASRVFTSSSAGPAVELYSPDPPGRSGRPVFERHSQLRQPLSDDVGLREQHLLRRVVLAGDLLGLRTQVV